MTHRSPGLIGGATAAVLERWNAQIAEETNALLQKPELARAAAHVVSHEQIQSAPVSIHWTADPAEPRFCLDADWARKLSDWGVEGRHLFHNEYCEYAMVTRVDDQGRVRLKRFTATTELAEWWTVVAAEDPPYLRAMAEEVLGAVVSYEDLYGQDVGDPAQLSPAVRRVRFAKQVAGHGQHKDLKDAGVPPQPEGDLNRRSALFMSHPINGLDDLIYIVLFGAQPYVVGAQGGTRIARLHEIFNAQGTAQLACRNADPAAAQGAFSHVLRSVAPDMSSGRGARIAFADPIGMYFVSFQSGQLFYNNQPVPASWTRFSRGVEGLYQRLEFGPSDNESAYLDDVVVRQGASERRVVGGYQLASLIEVGPKVLIGPEEQINPDWFTLPASDAPDCSTAEVCTTTVGPAKVRYEQERSASVVGLRGR